MKSIDRLAKAERAALAVEALLAEAAAARTDLASFFSLAMREEKTRAPVLVAPHQRVLFDFVLAHPRCVVRMPAGSSKTFCMAALTLWLLGLDPTVRGAIVSATQGQATKPLKLVADYLKEPELAAAVRLVFPALRPSARPADPWTQTAITVQRPPGIRDPSLVAVGIDGSLPGARLAWVVVDDILDRENTSTPSGRQKVYEFFDSTVLSRLDPTGSRVVVTNTPWHPDDLTYKLENAGWPTLTMDVAGGVKLSNVEHDWDTDDIRPSIEPGECYRLAANDADGYDTEETKPLWEARFSADHIDSLRKQHLPHRFNQLYMCLCRDDSSARCKAEWINRCKTSAIRLMSEYTGGNLTVTGVDLAVGQGSHHDESAFFTIELVGGKRRIIDVEVGRFDGPTIVKKIIDKAKRYKSIVRVENNAAQDYILQFARQQNASVPIKAHTTGRTKAHPEYGVEGVFIELMNGQWEIPCSSTGRCHKFVQRFIDDCLYYEPGAHTGDALMAAWFAREQARVFGGGDPKKNFPSGPVGMGLLAR